MYAYTYTHIYYACNNVNIFNASFNTSILHDTPGHATLFWYIAIRPRMHIAKLQS